MQTQRLNLIQQTREELLAMIAALSPEDKSHVSADWLARLHDSAPDDPWMHGFSVESRETGSKIGDCGFKGPPSTDGVVEIAYGIDPEHQRQGYATEAAEALVIFAFNSSQVRVVCAHTLPDGTASKRVLSKCGFRYIGEVVDPEDGLVWRWEKHRELAEDQTNAQSH